MKVVSEKSPLLPNGPLMTPPEDLKATLTQLLPGLQESGVGQDILRVVQVRLQMWSLVGVSVCTKMKVRARCSVSAGLEFGFPLRLGSGCEAQ